MRQPARADRRSSREFQFTHPGRGATSYTYVISERDECSFNSRTPGGVRLVVRLGEVASVEFQFTHPGRGATSQLALLEPLSLLFQFTHPGRGATKPVMNPQPTTDVSIHAPREGCDCRGRSGASARQGFNSRTPGGVRRLGLQYSFLLVCVSIHAPREGCDSVLVSLRLKLHVFQFTHPGRGATYHWSA